MKGYRLTKRGRRVRAVYHAVLILASIAFLAVYGATLILVWYGLVPS